MPLTARRGRARVRSTGSCPDRRASAGCFADASTMSSNRPSTWGRMRRARNMPASGTTRILAAAETHRWFDQNATSRSTNGRSLVMRASSALCASSAASATRRRRASRRSCSSLWPGMRRARTASPMAAGEVVSRGAVSVRPLRVAPSASLADQRSADVHPCGRPGRTDSVHEGHDPFARTLNWILRRAQCPRALLVFRTAVIVRKL